jgi:GAF domain
MRNPWLAIDVSTNPSTRAWEARVARDEFLTDPHAATEIRRPILDSWRRSLAAGIDPNGGGAPSVFTEAEAADLFISHPLGRLAPVLSESVTSVAGDAEHLVLISDPDGVVLWVAGDAQTRVRAADELNLVAGSRWNEQSAGTNAVGVALAADHAVQVFAGEHFAEPAQWWTCVAAPIHDPVSGRTIGSICVVSRMETVHPHTLALVSAVALALEAQLLATLGANEDLLLNVAAVELLGEDADAADRSNRAEHLLSLEVLGRDRAHVTVGDREFALSQRHSEILLLLSDHPGGLTGEQLAIALHGDEGKPVTARAEISRLRRLLGPCILETDPYRLDAEVRSDSGLVKELLREQRVMDAVELYAGPPLPRSEAPGVVDLRNEIEGWTRRSVLATDDLEALWAWLTTSSGEDDLHAWRRFLGNVDPEDGRRGLAAARLERLRALFSPSGHDTPRREPLAAA